jgi:hypothetical protein
MVSFSVVLLDSVSIRGGLLELVVLRPITLVAVGRVAEV